MNLTNKALVAACGIYCGDCPDYLAYINEDEKLKKKLAQEFSEQFGTNIKPEEVGCLGCHGPMHKAWSGLSCPMRLCAESKDILTCGSCDGFPCEKLERFYEKEDKEGGIRANILRQREIGLEKWLDEMKKSNRIVED